MVVPFFRAMLFLSATCVVLPVHAALTARLSDDLIDELETVRLIIRASGTRDVQNIDLSPLEDDFHVMGSNTSSQYQATRGRVQAWVDYQITLQPKRSGLLAIPPIQIGQERSPELTVTVRKLSQATRQAIDRLVFFESEVSKNEVYVQAEVVVTRRLLYSNGVQLYSDLPGAPDLPNAVVLVLGETSSSTTTREGKLYGVVEQRYAIFPEASGTLVVPGINVTASVRLVDNGRVSRKGVRVGTDDLTITVLPVPASYPPETPWLPAEDVRALQVVTPTRPVHYVGDTLTHELLVHVDGNIGSNAPPIDLLLSNSEFRVYPQTPVINDDTNAAIVLGSRLQTTSIVPTTNGTLKLPGLDITWWNTRTNTLETTTVAPLNLAVAGTPLVAPQPNTGLDADREAVTPAPSTEPAAELEVESFTMPWRAIITVIFVLALLAVLWIQRRHIAKLFAASLAALIHKLWPPSADARSRELLNALDGDTVSDARALKSRLAGALAQLYGTTPVDALARFRAEHPGVAPALAALDSQYARNAQVATHAVSGQTRTLIKNSLQRALAEQSRDTAADLPPLFSN